MTDTPSQTTPPGWYPDQSDPSLQRWWDGTTWTEHTQRGYTAGGVAAEQLKAPEGTSWNTPWIWLVLLLPLLSLFSLAFIDMRGYMEAILANPSNPNVMAAMGTLFSPGFIIAIVLGWVIVAATILFAYLDYKELVRRGVPRPFHWGFAFLALAGYGIVYPIGRGVITNRRGAGGIVVMWIAIATLALSIVVAVIWSVVITNQVMQAVLSTIPAG